MTDGEKLELLQKAADHVISKWDGFELGMAIHELEHTLRITRRTVDEEGEGLRDVEGGDVR